MPHMSNLPWMEIYSLTIMTIMMMYANVKENSILTEKSDSKKNKKTNKKWTW